MGCEAGRYNKTSTPEGIFILLQSLEGWSTQAKEAPSPHEVRLTPLDTNSVFQCLSGASLQLGKLFRYKRKGKQFFIIQNMPHFFSYWIFFHEHSQFAK